MNGGVDFDLVCDGGSEPALDYVNTQSTADLREGCEKVLLNAVVETSS